MRIAGFGYSTSYFQHITIGGQDYLADNPKFGWRFFPPRLARMPAPITMKPHKAPGTVRIFVFGESAAQGDPRPQFAASRYLLGLLQERFPGQQFEIVNTAMTAINSHAILPIARECSQQEGDIWIVYMGNNEMVGPFGAATVFGRKASPLPLVRLNLAIQRTRVGQLLIALVGKLRPASTQLAQWRGMEMFTRNEVPPNDRRREAVYDNFRKNLEDIVEAGIGAGAKVILSTVAVNLKDCPPFGSLKEAVLSPEEKQAYEKCIADGSAAAQQKDFVGAAQKYARAAQLLPQSADAQYRLGTALLAVTNTATATEHYRLSRDYDTLPFRTDSLENEIITQTAVRHGSRGVALCDTASWFATNSPAGIPGQELFYEHVHLNFSGNYQLALAWAKEVEKLLPTAARQKAGSWAPQERCESLIGLTDWNRTSAIEEVISRLGQPPLSSQPNNTQRITDLKTEIQALRGRMDAGSLSGAKAVYLEAIGRAPADATLRQNYVEFLDATGDTKEALAQMLKITELTPHSYFAWLNLGQTRREERQFHEAEDALLTAVKLNPNQPEVRLQLGAVYGLQNKHELAIREFALARQLVPDDPRPLHFAGEALWKMNRRTESLTMLREAIRIQSGYPDAHYRLGEELAQMGDIEAAAREFQEVIRLRPDHTKAHFNLGVALAKMRRLEQALREFDEVLRLEPQHKAALQFRHQALVDLGRQ